MGKRDPRIDAYVARSAPFARPILRHLRRVVHAGCPGVEETLKWSHPSFEYHGLLCGVAAFKQHCTFGFWKEPLLRGSIPAADQKAWGHFGRITTLSDLPGEKTLLRLVRQAASLNQRGVKVPNRAKRDPKPPPKAPADLMAGLRKNRMALATFEGFSPSNQREYVEWITEAKSDGTRTRRLETAVAWMAEGKIRNWKYVKK